MIPALIGSVAGSAFNGLMNSAFNSMNMESQAEVSRDLMDYQWKNFSSPQAQVKAWSEAGFSPVHIFGNGGSGSSAVPSVPSVSHSPIMTDGVQNMANFAKSFNEDKKNVAEKEKFESEKENQDIQNATQLRRDIAYLDNLIKSSELSESEKKKKMAERDTLLENLFTLDSRNRAEIERNESEARLNDAKATLTDAQITYQQIVNELEPQQRRALIKQIYAHEAELIAAAREHNASAVEKAAEAALKGVDKTTKEKLMPALIDKAQAEADLEWFKTGNEAKRYVGGELGYRTPVVGHGGSYNSYSPRYRYHKH